MDEFLSVAKKGALVITGPEGSGRTNFLYTLLTRSKEGFHNIHTLENTIRYPLTGVRQQEIREENMEKAMEEYLFQSVDLLAISPLKSVRAAEIAFLLAARMPVVMVLSSFDAFKAVEWLCGHHLKSPVKAKLLHTVVSPRMIPRVCPHCAVPFDAQGSGFTGINLPAGVQLRMNQGCDQCRNNENLPCETFFESFRINDEAIEWIQKDHSSAHLRNSARAAGRSTLYDLVVRDAFSDQFDMLSLAKLQAAL